MLTYSNPNEEIKLTMTFGCYEEVYALQRAIINVLRDAQSTTDQRTDADIVPVLDLLEATLLESDQVSALTQKAVNKAA